MHRHVFVGVNLSGVAVHLDTAEIENETAGGRSFDLIGFVQHAEPRQRPRNTVSRSAAASASEPILRTNGSSWRAGWRRPSYPDWPRKDPPIREPRLVGAEVELGSGNAGGVVAHPQRGEMRSPADCADHVATEAIEKDDTRTAGGEPMVGDCCSITAW